MGWLEAKEGNTKQRKIPGKGGGGTGSEGLNKEENYFLPSKMEAGMRSSNVM